MNKEPVTQQTNSNNEDRALTDESLTVIKNKELSQEMIDDVLNEMPEQKPSTIKFVVYIIIVIIAASSLLFLDLKIASMLILLTLTTLNYLNSKSEMHQLKKSQKNLKDNDKLNNG